MKNIRQRSINRSLRRCWPVVIALGCFVPSFAQDSTKPANKWHIFLEPYLMFPNMHGTSGLGTLPDAAVDEDPGDIFSHLRIGAMLYIELYKGPWAITSDFTYMKLGEDVTVKNGIVSGDATIKQLAWEVAVLRRIKPWLEGGAALQLNNIGADLDLQVSTPGGIVSGSKGLTETWVDPSIVARIKLPLSQNNKWHFQWRGNVGGFGVGSDFFWQMQAYFSYRFSGVCQGSLGYRYIGINYENGGDSDRFLYDMDTFGPVIRFGFNF